MGIGEETGKMDRGTGNQASIKPLHINRGFLRKLGLIGKRERQFSVLSSQWSVVSSQFSVIREQVVQPTGMFHVEHIHSVEFASMFTA